ncbi:MAG: phenylacetic acid degradation protein PaaN [Cytophagales bacterium CG12_big_fil_rev_8_21_14_0_65_40_12]|nr:MAG: phenylacetic acid degradation protein PaaN [Cytophagales bacterium CG12_big_fil_rev_8_21_14_0_65_40_12]PIW03732.1 MAG: phenylacetic acid degradation protein PaaN [Cytophagales bacterium CG17_big_fil_post_rev_8_21_14_2_50_40_13]
MGLTSAQKDILDKAVSALHTRGFHAQYPEHPSPAIYGETADADGKEAFKALRKKNFDELGQEGASAWIGEEESPYFQAPLGPKYPSFSTEELIARAEKGFHSWRKVALDDRAAVLIDSLERFSKRFFENAYATMHTTGQGYMMAFQASGPHAADRALEAIAAGYDELNRFPSHTQWEKPMGKYNLLVNKEWRAVPKGIGLVIGCSTFPTWNSVPGVYASLITGNSVLVKPHPGAILPMAIVVAEIRNALREAGFNPDACQLAVDVPSNPIALTLAKHPKVKLIDFTGNSAFGSVLEALPKAVFTEKTGVNSIILDSVEDLDKVIQNITFSVALYSGQMCTAPQNFFIPAEGVKTPDGMVSFDEVAQKFADFTNGLVDNPKAGPFVLGAIQNPMTCDRAVNAAKELGGKVWLETRTIVNPIFDTTRTQTPVVIELTSADKDKFSKELFGPIALLIKTKNTEESVALAKELAETHGAISCGAYTTDAAMKEHIADEMSLAATPVSFNLTGQIFVNQNAAFSDYHVTGGNPAGNASFTNPDYVNRRFTWVGIRELA